MKDAYLVLGDGRVFRGKRIGAEGDAVGELVFHTGVVGYVETLTDPAYAGQIVMQTFPLVGNYGVMEEDFEGESAVSAYVVQECCDTPSNFRCEYTLDTFLKRRGIPGICGVDTRELTRILREEGVMNAKICDTPPADPSVIRDYALTGSVAQVSRKQPQVYPAAGKKCYAVTLIDYGVTHSLIRALCQRGCEVTAVPFDTTAEAILATRPDGVVLSGGPGDPHDIPGCAAELKTLIGQVPVWGVGLGHQLAALAMGGTVTKLHHGHRGGNQPVKEAGGNRTYITAQNHGYVVDAESLAGVGVVTFVNVHDDTCEGVTYPGRRCFTLQFTPTTAESAVGTAFLYDRFLDMMGVDHNAQR